MPVSLFDFANLPTDVLAWYNNGPRLNEFDDRTELVRSDIATYRASQQIDPAYIVNGAEAYVARILFLGPASRLTLNLASTASDGNFGVREGPELTDAAEMNLGIAVRLTNGTVYKYAFANLIARDPTEPYDWDNVEDEATWDAIVAAIRADSGFIRSLLVDTTNPNVDFDRLIFTPDPALAQASAELRAALTINARATLSATVAPAALAAQGSTRLGVRLSADARAALSDPNAPPALAAEGAPALAIRLSANAPAIPSSVPIGVARSSLSIQLRLRDDRGNEAPLPIGVQGNAAGGWHLTNAPVRAQSLVPHAVHDGPAVHERTRDLVSETVNVWLPQQASTTALRDRVQAIERLLETANRGGAVWIEYDSGEPDDNLWRSPVMAGDLAWQRDMRLRWRNRDAQLQVRYSREPWWEGDSRVAQLARGSTLRNAAAPAIGQAGSVTARASNAAGTLPAPLTLTWTLPGSSRSNLRFYAFHRHDASDSHAGIYTATITIARTNLQARTESRIAAAAVPTATPAWRRVILESVTGAPERDADRNAPLWLRAGPGTATDALALGPWTRAGYYEGRASRFSDLGPLYLDRAFVYVHAWSESALETSAMRIHLAPVDGYRSYHVAGSSPAGARLVDAGGALSGPAAGATAAEGEPLLLTPGRAGEFFMLAEDADGNTPDPMTLAAAWRPRRLSI